MIVTSLDVLKTEHKLILIKIDDRYTEFVPFWIKSYLCSNRDTEINVKVI